MKDRKENKSEKEVKPVKKSVALILTVITVFAFAAVCFSLGFCSGNKAKETYAVPIEIADYTIEKGRYIGIDTPTFFGPNINQAMTFQANNITFIRSYTNISRSTRLSCKDIPISRYISISSICYMII